MNIDFEKVDLSVIPNFKGGEKELRARMFFDGTNRIMKGLLVPGASIGMHTHEDNCEMILILSGVPGCAIIVRRGIRIASSMIPRPIWSFLRWFQNSKYYQYVDYVAFRGFAQHFQM